MHDVNGKAVHVGDRVKTNAFGVCTIVGVLSEDNAEKQGANVLLRKNGEDFAMRLHVGGAVRIPLMSELAREAMDVQNACNLSGVVHSFSRLLPDLRFLLNEELGEKFNGDLLNTHAICILFSSKIASLTRSEWEHNFHDAYSICKDMLK